jgi:ribonuclease HI
MTSHSLALPAQLSAAVISEPAHGQTYAIQARRYIAALRKARPDITIAIRWCPAHEGIIGNEKTDEWAKVAAAEPDTRGVEWTRYTDRYGRRPMPPPRSLAHLKREVAEKT